MRDLAKTKYRILVVDDDLELNTSIALLLEFDGHEVCTVVSGEAALQKLSAEPFDLLLSEYWLPRLRGDELSALVKQRWPHLPIILVTANFEEILTEDHPFPGVSCLLDKPFSMSQLRGALNWVMGPPAAPPRNDWQPHWVGGGYGASSEAPRDVPERDA